METTTHFSGVKAEPRFLRDPTSLESLSSGISRFSSYVTSNLPKRKPSVRPYELVNDSQLQQLLFQHHQQLDASTTTNNNKSSSRKEEEDGLEDELEEEKTEEHHQQDQGHQSVTYSSFQTMDLPSLHEQRTTKRTCLVLGYSDGFQVWDVTNPDNVHEMCSIREPTFGTVSHVHVLENPCSPATKDQLAHARPLLAIVSLQDPSEEIESHGSCVVRFYSLRTHTIVKEIKDFGQENESIRITDIGSNQNTIVLGCVMRHRSLLYLLSSCDLSRSTPPLTDVYHEHTQGPVFTLGTRLIAYATNGPVSNSDPVMSTFHHGIGTSLGVLNGEKDVKGAAKDIAKEMVNGMKTLSGIGYQTLSTYLSKPPQEAPFPVLRPNISPPLRQEEKSSLSSIASTNSNANSNSNSNSNTNSNSNSNTNSNSNSNTINTNTINTAGVLKKTAPSGMIMIRDLHKLSSARSLSGSTLAHFRPHLHAITCLTFNAAGTLVMSVSKQGRTFHIFSILPSGRHVGNAAHLYSLSRGYTDAQVEDCQFSLDSMWCVISTARGTAHVYAINPYGGKPEITGHVSGRVNNQVHHPLSRHTPLQVTSLGSTVRIKQRRPMPAEPMPLQDTHTHPHSHPHSHPHTHTHTHTHPHSHPPTHLYTTPHHTHPPPPPRAKLTTHFLSKTRTPYLVNNSHFGKGSPPTHQRHTSLPLSQTPLMVLRNPASSLGSVLSSFGSSVAGSPIGSLLPAQRSPTWAGGKDKAGDHRLFEFDEEEDALEEDATKMVDETGYQDLYSFHPQGVLTLHRCWVMKSVVKRREQGRVIEKLGLSIKEEDVAEWQVSRSSEWGQVKFPLQVKESKSLEKEFVGSPSTEQVQPTQPTQPVQAQKNASKAAKKAAKAQSTPPPSVPEPKTTLSWLSSAEINTYANVADEPALWTLSQFHLQTYDTSDLRALEEMLALGHVPPTHPICVRKDIPEPYSSRIDRVGKTTTRITNKEDENLEDALAELQDNISKAMQTSFASSPTLKTPLGSSPGQMSKWLSTSTGGMGSSHGSAGSTARSPMQISSVSFEDAYLISMGGAPGLDTNYESNEFIPVRTSHQGLENSSLIRFDEDEDESRMETQPSPEETGTGLGEIFSPDGDNEVAYPSDSVFEEFMYKG